MMVFKVCARWFSAIVRSNTFIYWSLAAYATSAMQWKPLWAAAPFIVFALLYKAYSVRRGLVPTNEQAQTVAVVTDDQVPTFDAPAIRPAMDSRLDSNSKIEPEVDVIPELSILERTNWAELASPTWRRRGLDFTALIKPGACSPFEAKPDLPKFSLIEDDEPDSEKSDTPPIDCEFIYS